MGDDHLRSAKQNVEQLQRKLQQAQESAEAGGHAAACGALSGMHTPVPSCAAACTCSPDPASPGWTTPLVLLLGQPGS